MENNYHKHLIERTLPVKKALEQLNDLGMDAILFVVDEQKKLIGSLTDGDIRRGFLRNLEFSNSVEDFIQPHPKFIEKRNYNIKEIIAYREQNFRILPVVDRQHRVVNILNFRFFKSYLPIDAVIMAGGRGERLRPLTDVTPKPLLQVGEHPIIEHNINRLCSFGVDDFWISVRYLGEKIKAHFGDGQERGAQIQYIEEDEPLGTIGAARKIPDLAHDYVLVMNSDILTNIDFEDFFLDFLDKEADMAVATVPYAVNVPYAVLETSNHHIISFKEKPTYTYYSNGGIYLLKREVIERIPERSFYNSTDLMQELLNDGKKVISYPMRNYWLDIGRPEDYMKAQEDIKHISLK